MKIVVTCGNLLAGGAERVVSILSNKLVDLGHEVFIFTWYKTEIFYKFDKRVQICQIPTASGKNNFGGQMMWFRYYIRKNTPDVILSFLAPFNILTVFSLYGVHVPVLVAERNDPLFVSPHYNGFWKIVRNIAYWLSDGILVQTKINQSHFPKCLQKKSSIIYNPVIFESSRVGIALKTSKKKSIVSVTRLENQKNVELLIRAFTIFHKNHEDYTLTIYGEGDNREELESLIKKLEMRKSIFLPGRIQNVHELIIEAELFAMASNFEGMSNSLIEAMCLGLPCISTKVSGAVDLIDDHQNGILVEIGDLNGMVAALTELADNYSLRNKIGNNASKVYNVLNADIIVDKWMDYLYNFCKRQSI